MLREIMDNKHSILLVLFLGIALEIGVNFPVYLEATPSSQNLAGNDQLDQLEQEYSNPALVTGITQNLLTVVSFLVGTTSFVLGLTIQNASRLTPTMNSYFKTMILALLIPAIIIITYGVFVTAATLDPGDEHYLLLLFALYVPSGTILFILRKLHAIK
jgi:hypothetical protein